MEKCILFDFQDIDIPFFINFQAAQHREVAKVPNLLPSVVSRKFDDEGSNPSYFHHIFPSLRSIHFFVQYFTLTRLGSEHNSIIYNLLLRIITRKSQPKKQHDCHPSHRVERPVQPRPPSGWVRPQLGLHGQGRRRDYRRFHQVLWRTLRKWLCFCVVSFCWLIIRQVLKVEENLPSRRKKNCQVAIRNWFYCRERREEWQPRASIYFSTLTRNIWQFIQTSFSFKLISMR